MKIDKQHIDYLKVGFSEMESVTDLLQLLNYIKPLIYGDKSVPFELRQLTYYTNPKRSAPAYKSFEVKKKSGECRKIMAPTKGLKSIQKCLSVLLQSVFEPHNAAKGFVWNKSIIDNAKVHSNSNYVYNIDLKDFFPSIDKARVWSCLQLKPFSLVNEKEELIIKEGIKNFKHIQYLPRIEFVENHYKKYWFVAHYFVPGRYEIVLKNNNKLVYTIERLKERSIFSGEVKIFTRYSDFDFIEEAAKAIRDNQNEEVELDRAIELLIGSIIGLHQFELYQKGLKLKIANMISALCCAELDVERIDDKGNWQIVKKEVLPQGAPTSPVISNIVCQRLDYLLNGLAKRFGLRYTRYADDITFSSMHNVYQKKGAFLKELERIIMDQGFHMNSSKTRLQKRGYRQEVTGLLVNDKVNVQRRYNKQLRMWLYYWEQYGYERSSELFAESYAKDKPLKAKDQLDMKLIIGGKLDYLRMVKGHENQSYKKLRKRFDRLIEKMSPLEQILDVWESKGIDKAIELYCKN